MDYRREIDGLRALAVLPVIFFHSGLNIINGGFVGVDIFFVISGYLITTIIISELESGNFSIVSFYERRARRILPSLLLVLFTIIPFAWLWMLPEELDRFSSSIVATILSLNNHLLSNQSNYFDVASELKPLLHTWSLAVEEQYYLLFPALMIATWPIGKRWVAFILTAILFISLFAAHTGSTTNPAATFYLLPTRAWELMLGSLAALYLFTNKKLESKHQIDEAGSLAGLALIIYSNIVFDRQTPFPSLYTLVPTLGTALIILFATRKTIVGHILGNRIFVGIGLISYSAYLWHQPLFSLARQANTRELNSIHLLGLIVVTLALASLSWWFVERPFRRKDVFSRRQIFQLSFIGCIMLAIIGSIGHFRHGDIWRYSEQDLSLFGNISHWKKYVWKTKDSIELKPFDPAKTIKIFIIGDSNSGDLINALQEADTEKLLSLSSLTIDAGCGNLYIDEQIFSKSIEPSKVDFCAQKRHKYHEKTANELLKNASMIILASAWSPWEASAMAKNLSALRTQYGNKLFIFGTKQLAFNPRIIIRTPAPERYSQQTQPTADGIRINNILKASAQESFLDPYDMLCKEAKCPLFDEHHNLLTYDGFHLTEAGARLLGQRLKQHALLAPLQTR